MPRQTLSQKVGLKLVSTIWRKIELKNRFGGFDFYHYFLGPLFRPKF